MLDFTSQEEIKAKRDGVFLIKASSQPGIANGSPQLLFLHDTFPFEVDLVIGYGRVTGAAAAHQAKRLNCKRLHIFHTSSGEEQNCHSASESAEERESERELGLSADFVGAIGPLLKDEWSAVLNREVIELIPGMSEVEKRNSIPTPQYRCMVLGDLSNDQMLDLDKAARCLAHCKRRKQAIKLLVRGTEQKKMDEVEENLKSYCSSKHVKVEVKRFDVSKEMVDVDIRGVSLVIMPFSSDSFGITALDAFAAGVPVLMSESCGMSQVIREYLDPKFSDLLIGPDEEDWTVAIDKVFDDRDQAFHLASDLRQEWIRTFTWDRAAESLFSHLSRSGSFCFHSPRSVISTPIPPRCPERAIQFVEDLCLTDRRHRHVLFVSPQDKSVSPFIEYLAMVPWISVFDFDINSVSSGCLASSHIYCQNSGMKVCRILPPGPGDEGKTSVTLPNGVSWVLVEGIPESSRNVGENLEWAREFFLALGKNYPLPITFVILWKSSDETSILCRKLCKLLTLVEGSSLRSKVKLSVVSTGEFVDRNLQDTAADWDVPVTELSLEDFCNAILTCATAQPFTNAENDFELPAAGIEKVRVVPAPLRWINAELDVLYLSTGNHPEFGEHDAHHFYRGGTISWYALKNDYAIERESWKAVRDKIDDLLIRAGTMSLRLPHKRGTGGTTSARKILFDYHWEYPCVCLKPGNRSEVMQAIKQLAEFTGLPVLVLIDCKQVQGEEFDLDMLYTSLSNNRVPCVLLEVYHLRQQGKYGSDKHANQWKASPHTPPVCLADTLSGGEIDAFVEVYSYERKSKLGKLRELRSCEISELQIPFYYALVTFEEEFTALEPFVQDCLKNLHNRERQVLLFLAMAHHYGHNSLNAGVFAEILQAPFREVISLESYLQEAPQQLLLEEDGKWRPRHDVIAAEMLRQLLTAEFPERQVNTANWPKQLAEKAIECISHMPEAVVSDMLLNRVTDEHSHRYFSPLINDIPDEEDAISVFQKAISVFPDNPFFKVHLGRFYSIEKKIAGFDLAIRYTDEGIQCVQDSASRTVRGQFAQMKGVVYSRQVSHMISQGFDLAKIIEMAEEGVKYFRRAISLSPDVIDGYIPQVRMLCKLFEHVDRDTEGGLLAYLELPDAAPFILDGISSAFDTLECVPDSDEYAYWRMRLVCLTKKAKYHHSAEEALNIKEILELLARLKASAAASIAPINRRIVRMKMDLCQKENKPLHSIARELLALLNEALKYDSKRELTMRLWVFLAPLVPVDLSTAESKIFQWCAEEKSVHSFLYKYIIACIHVLEGGSRSYSEIMKNAYEDLHGAIRAISRCDIGRYRHPDRPVVWLGKQSEGMSQLLFIDDKSSALKDVRLQRFLPSRVHKLRQLTGIITETGAKVGNIRVNNLLDVSFRADLCATPLVSDVFRHRRVKFFLAFTFFGTDAYNVKLVAD